MTLPVEVNPLLTGGGGSGYNISRSVRLRSSASATLTRTFGPTFTDKTKWTSSVWVKRSKLNDSAGQMFFQYNSAGAGGNMGFSGAGGGGASINDDFIVNNRNATTGVGDYGIRLLRLFRDSSAWYHIVVKFDSTQVTSSNRVLVYVNGEQQFGFGSDTAYPALNYQSTAFFGSNAVAHQIGYGAPSGAGNYFDGYLTDINFIDGQALTPSSFGGYNSVTGGWEARKYTGTYGNNGFCLNFSDNSAATAAAIGKDSSGNGNNWTPNNISLTAGVTYDSMLDVPTMWADGGNGRGNYATINPVNSYLGGQATITNANLTYTSPNPSSNYAVSGVRATIGFNSDKFYWEHKITLTPGINGQYFFGVTDSNASLNNGSGFDNGYFWGYDPMFGTVKVNGSNVTTVTTSTLNDTIGLAFDRTSGTMSVYKNNVLLTSQTTSISGNGGFWIPSWMIDQGFNIDRKIAFEANFGQRPFSYTPPSGFKALHTGNLPAPAITKPNKNFDVSLYTGTGAARSITNAGGFAPDLVWIKNRSNVADHALQDTVRGITNVLRSSSTVAEFSGGADYVTAVTSSGFTEGSSQSVNASSQTYAAWQWKAGGTAVSNTAGTITSQVSANASAGFSVVTYTGTGANATVGHGLGVAPKMVIVKNRTTVGYNWPVYHSSIGNTGALLLNLTNAVDTNIYWNNITPTSSTFSVGTVGGVNNVSTSIVAYCFSEIAGYSKMGSYIGNGSVDGPFVYTGFRPAFIMLKRTDVADEWAMQDNARPGYNATNLRLIANSSGAELATQSIDLTSNGFKIRSISSSHNQSGGTYIYMAFAETPFKNALAR